MKNAIVAGFRQASEFWIMIVPALTAAVILLGFVDPVIRAYREKTVFSTGFHLELLNMSIHSDSVSSFLPILAALPFGGCVLEDLKSRYARFLLVRCSYCTYLISRIVVGFLAGGLTIILGALMAWGISAVVLIPMECEDEIFKSNIVDSLLQSCCLLFLNGGLWSVVGMAMSMFLESKYIAYASPFVIYYLLLILYERYFSYVAIIHPKTWINPVMWSYGCWGAAVFLLEMTMIFVILFFIRAGNRVRQL